MNAESVPDGLGPFRPLEVLGQGGSGVVYRAQWGHREVALKVLREDAVVSDEERQRFLDEARRLSEMPHPAIVKILSYGELPDGRPYLVMELLTGETLGARLERGPMPVEGGLRLFFEAAGAVGAMHAEGLIHRDLKPENLYVVEGDQIVLLDFGIAKRLDGRDSTATREGRVRGTPAYMAPERFFGEPASIATDIYELAVVLYVMLRGELPWSDERDPLARLDPAPLGLAGLENMDVVLRRALSTRGVQRPRSVEEMVGQLKAAQSSPSPRQTRKLGPEAADEEQPGLESSEPGLQGAEYVSRAAEEKSPLQRCATREAPPSSQGRGRGALVALGAFGLVAASVAGTLAVVDRLGSPARDALPLATSTLDAGELPERSDAASALAVRAPRRGGDDSGLETLARHLPADTQFVATFRARHLRQHEVLEEFFEELKAHPRWAGAEVVRESCGIDLMDDTDWAAIATHDREAFEVVVAGAWTRSSAEDCLLQWAMVGESGVRRDGPVTRISAGDTPFALVWLDERTFFLSTRDKPSQRWLKKRFEGKGGMNRGGLANLAQSVDATSSMWFLGRGEELLGAVQLPELAGWLPRGATLEAWTIEINLDEGLSARARLRLSSPRQARAVRDALKEKLAELLADPANRLLLGDLRVQIDEPDVLVFLSLGPGMTRMVGSALRSSFSKP